MAEEHRFTSTAGGVMTDEAGAVTGELEVLCRPDEAGVGRVLVRYVGADEWYTVAGGRIGVQGTREGALRRVVQHLSTPGPVVDGNERATSLEGFSWA